MEAQNVKKVTNHTSIFRSSIASGVSGCFGVFCQTIALLWHFNVQHEQSKIGLSFREAAAHIYKQGGINKFYHGFLPSLRFASLARFGDLAINSFIMKEINLKIKRNDISILIKSAIVWAFASTWRLAMIPFLAINSQINQIFLQGEQRQKLLRSIRRIYVKRTRPEIMSLYFWFAFHNIFDSITPPLQYGNNLGLFILRHSFAGFGSMVCYDLFLEVYRRIVKTKGSHSSHNVLLGDCESKTFIKGIHGVVFCTTSNLFKLYISKKKHKE